MGGMFGRLGGWGGGTWKGVKSGGGGKMKMVEMGKWGNWIEQEAYISVVFCF